MKFIRRFVLKIRSKQQKIISVIQLIWAQFHLNWTYLKIWPLYKRSMTLSYFDLYPKNETSYEFRVIDFFFLLLMTQGRIWHALQPYWSMLTILVPCSFTPPVTPCTRLIFVSTLGVFIRPQWTVRYPQSFYIFTMQVDLACSLCNC